ncbi:hypothetical protein KIN20_013456 [Parelaphostrongylus tenuis]|uniref:Uncharacterized protein n=1 Tax=Parelaphostrongylus tenuis TaxID=148309 RepID=A0AAD5QL22_PARTN|nr:hypothetical protein KIN20_013456 [Parelaphostrongylus tenuis]
MGTQHKVKKCNGVEQRLPAHLFERIKVLVEVNVYDTPSVPSNIQTKQVSENYVAILPDLQHPGVLNGVFDFEYLTQTGTSIPFSHFRSAVSICAEDDERKESLDVARKIAISDAYKDRTATNTRPKRSEKPRNGNDRTPHLDNKAFYKFRPASLVAIPRTMACTLGAAE